MATVALEHVSKTYAGGVRAVVDLSLDVADGEFMVLVGPSGCGKTTALRMVAGLEEITEGTVTIGDVVVNDLSPRERDVAMVFQNYALYPHMTVGENIGFALKLAKIPKDKVQQKVKEAANILGLAEHLDRKPSQLSGGQRQRVAMGRAIVREPAAFLMDEPLSNLDAKLRVQMRTEIARIQRRLNVATIYVTHDQTEAMTMGDRVAVLCAGELQQCEEPQVLYDHPVNLFVAAFIGSPPMNLYHGTLSSGADEVTLGSQRLPLEPDVASAARAHLTGSEVVVGIRPENLHDLALTPSESDDAVVEGDVDVVEALGSELLVYFHLDAARVRAPGSIGGSDVEPEQEALGKGELAEAGVNSGVARLPPTSRLRAGTRARFGVDVERVMLFDPNSGLSLDRGRELESQRRGPESQRREPESQRREPEPAAEETR